MQACLKSRPVHFIVKLMVVIMVFQGWPLWELSKAYTWEFQPQKLVRLIQLLGPASAEAAPPKVICVPQLPTDLLVPHETWSGEPTILKGVAKDEDGDLGGGTYEWDFGDGSPPVSGAIGNPDNLAVTHTYTGNPGDLFIARLLVTDAAGESSTDDYRILLRAITLDLEVNKAIDDGLWWIYTNKQGTPGRFYWNNVRYGSHYGNSSASAVQAFEINGHLEYGDPDEDPYVDAVQGGLAYLLSTISTVNIGPQTYGDPDTNGNGIGLNWPSNRPIYELGAIMDALVATGTPDAVAQTGGANVIGRRYQDIVQDMVDMYAWGQYDHATIGGGWRYSWNSAGYDNSASQWGAIGMIPAERLWGCTVPQWVKDRNNVWLNYSYNGTGFGYIGRGNGWATTPSGMVQLSFGDRDNTDSRWVTAENYLANNWSGFITTGRNNRYYSYYAFTKAMRLANPQEVTNLAATGLDWYGDDAVGLARILVNRQNANGSWAYDGWPYVGERTAAWNVIILTRTLFEKPPVAVIQAEPNPGAVGQAIQLDGFHSYHVDPAKEIVEYIWDFDATDGVNFDPLSADAVGPFADAVYGALGDYMVSLKVIDNSTPERFDTSSLTVHITIPPHPPTAVIGGPYIASVGETVQVDGSGSYDIDETEGDFITAYDWETDFVAPYDFNEASGVAPLLPGFASAGHKDIALRVTDNTSVVFPQSGSPDLTDTAYGAVMVYELGVTDLYARPKATKCQLVWTHIGAGQYEVLRSEIGPNEGFDLIGTTDSTYSTYIDYNVQLQRSYWYRIRCEMNGDTLISGPLYMISVGRIRNLPPEIISTPVEDAQEEVLYEYDVDATDPEGTALTYLLDQAPAGMTIDAATGLIEWTPTFAQVGVSDVTVRVQDARRASATQFFQIVVTPRPNLPPVAVPIGPGAALTGETISFDGSGSYDPNADPIVEYHWVFGDGADAYGPVVTHAYMAGGLYTVTLYVTDDRGATGSAETTCQIDTPNQAPVADAGGPYEQEDGVAVQLDGSASYDPDFDLLTFSWSFGDSTPDASGLIVSHTYAAQGVYTATLTVEDGRGGMATDSAQVTITPPNQPPVAAFSVTGDLYIDATLTFDGTASFDPEGQPLIAYEWDFGDGATTTGAVVTHVYSTVGDHTVTLTVTDDHGTPGSSQQTLGIATNMAIVPGVVGMLQADAEAAIATAILQVGAVGQEYHLTVPLGHVISQAPAAGASVLINTPVDLIVSLGVPMATVPDVVGMTQTTAESTITGAVLTVGTVTTANSSTVPAGNVISQNPAAGTIVPENDPVDIVVSLGPVMVTVPDVVGDAQAAAEAAIVAAGLVVGTVSTAGSATVPAGDVISQSPGGGIIVPEGSPVNLVVSLGPIMVTVPDVVSLAQAAAEAAVVSAGLTVGTVTTTNSATVPAGDVISQNPAGGMSVLEGSAVDLVVSRGELAPDDLLRPEVTLIINPPAANVGDTVTLTVNAADDVGVVSRALTVDGIPIALNGSGTGFFSSATAGVFTAYATADDAEGNQGYASGEFRFLAAGDVTPPTASISGPPDDAVITEPTDILGTADDATIVRYLLQYSPKDQNEWTTFGEGETPVAGGVLGTIDPSLLRNGLYDVRLTVEDASGNTASITRTYQMDGEAKVGLFTISFPDLTIPVAGIPITIVRTYDSRVKSKEDFGIGWSIDINSIEIQENMLPGVGWQLYCRQSLFGTCINWGVEPSTDHKVVVNVPGQQPHEFEVRTNASYANPQGLAQGNLSFEPFPGTFSTLQALGGGTYDFLMGGELMDFNFMAINPNRYLFTDEDGTEFVLNQTTGIEQIIDPNGNTITFTAGGIIHSAGKSVLFSRDAEGRITSITDPLGNVITYVYDFYGDLVSVTDQEGYTMRFTYNSVHGLVDIVDPRGYTPARQEYDAEGRLVATIDADGNRIEYAHDIGAQQEVVTDRLGNITVYNYDDDGNVLSETDALGNTTTYTYDAHGNELTKTDALGNTITKTYDAKGNKLSQTDALGNTTTWTYNSRNDVLTKTDPSVNVTTYTYDASGNKLTETNALGGTKTWTYDGSGNMLTKTDAGGNTTTYTYDSSGNKTSETDALGNVTTFTYDANGNQLSETDPLGRTTSKVYDSLNQLIEITDPLGNNEQHEYNSVRKRSAMVDKNGNRTEYEYDRAGNAVRSVYPDGTVETNTYDAEGNRLSNTDRAGRVTTYTYDALNRMIQTVHPDGTSVQSEYDAVGRVVASIDENGNRTEFAYDAVGNQTVVTDALGNTSTYAYDDNSNPTSMTDANGNTTLYEYDALNRKVRTIYPDGTASEVDYALCCKDLKLSETDQAGYTTQFEYDELGRLIGVTDALGNVTQYAYDEVGNRITQTDANGNVNTWTYDELGRVLTHTLPGGQVESFTYDALGNQLSKTDFNGDTIYYTYDVNNRLVTKASPNPADVYESFAYTPTGQRASATDARGVTAYSYDLRDRLVGVTHPDGSTIAYTYDLRGNRLSVTVPSSTTAYAYDALGRPVTVTDPDGGVTAYTYDAAGNRTSVAYPNGTVASYTYDTLNRLTLLENRQADTTLISSYAYTLGVAGNRLSVTEGSGRVVDYTYDAVYRLVEEDITDAVLGNETISYTYDAVGNRLTKTDSGGTVTYAYDANDRLLSETGATYTYDANGNTLEKTEGTDTTTYSYDYENRLVGAITPADTLAYQYDADGIRVSTSVNGALTRYLVDHNRDYAQVLEERDSVGTLIVSYVYGDDLISQTRGSVPTYYHYDGQMSTRQLTSAAEAVVNTYVYDAFGILLDQAGAAANHYMYTGEQYDPNVGFYYLRARYYNQQNGRFVTRDPAQGNPFDPVTLHKYLYANANPLRYLDPSGEMSLVNVMVTVAIVGILASVAYASFFHLLSIMHTPVRWEGILMYGGGGGAGVGATGFWTRLESGCYNGKKANGHYLMAGAGGMLGPIPVGMGVGFVSLITPGMFGPKPWTLIGTFSWMSATAAWGVGISYTAFYMGMGIGELGIIPGVAFGIDVGLVALGGISIPIYMSDQIDC